MIVDVPGIPIRKKGGVLLGYAIVDPEDFVRLNDHKWHLVNRRYVVRTGPGATTIYMHREVLGLGPGTEPIDHVNGDPLDNRRANLRVTTHAQNGQNKASWRPGFGYRGVTFNKRDQLWIAQAGLDNRTYRIGSFATEEEAAAAAAAWRREHMPFTNEERAAA